MTDRLGLWLWANVSLEWIRRAVVLADEYFLVLLHLLQIGVALSTIVLVALKIKELKETAGQTRRKTRCIKNDFS